MRFGFKNCLADAFITNIDRTFKNTNLLWWHKELWVIDNGASFYFHHSWQNFDTAAKTPFKYVKTTFYSSS
jgi:hypothetical protein